VCPGVVDAYKNMGDAITVPNRLQGTNAAIAKELIDNSGMPISAVEFQEAADQVKAALLN
jgi:succinyl-CoA synthetase beta subunit